MQRREILKAAGVVALPPITIRNATEDDLLQAYH